MLFVRAHTHSHTGGMKAIEGGLSEEITYLTQVSTVHPHEGSVYGAEKVGMEERGRERWEERWKYGEKEDGKGERN